MEQFTYIVILAIVVFIGVTRAFTVCDPENCSGHGTCMAEGLCSCDPGFESVYIDPGTACLALGCTETEYDVTGECFACNCSSSGSTALNCTDTTGVCDCKIGYVGTKCTDCDIGFIANGTLCSLPTETPEDPEDTTSLWIILIIVIVTATVIIIIVIRVNGIQVFSIPVSKQVKKRKSKRHVRFKSVVEEATGRT
jgi:hypothetical protein